MSDEQGCFRWAEKKQALEHQKFVLLNNTHLRQQKNLYRMQAAQAFPGITFISLNSVYALSAPYLTRELKLVLQYRIKTQWCNTELHLYICQHGCDEIHSYVSHCANWAPNILQPHEFRQMTAFQEILSELSFWTLAKAFFFKLNLKSWNIKEHYAST